MAIFQTGKIIITGARFMYQIEEAYQFLLNVLHKHAYDVLRISDPAQKVPDVPQKAKRASRRKKGLLKIA
jgi:TATA-box binding protein (TBP) (component of TFIID and TFIIIB)